MTVVEGVGERAGLGLNELESTEDGRDADGTGHRTCCAAVHAPNSYFECFDLE